MKDPHVWDRVKILYVAFPSSYLVERAFCAVIGLLDNSRNRLHKVRRGDLQLFLTKMEPDIKKLMKLHQAGLARGRGRGVKTLGPGLRKGGPG